MTLKAALPTLKGAPKLLTKLLINFGLCIAAWIIFSLFVGIFLLWAVGKAALLGEPRTSAEYLADFALAIAISVDMLGNVVGRDFLNDVFIKRQGYRFGNNKETISRVLGKNKAQDTLTEAGRILSNFLNWLDENHVEKAALDLYDAYGHTYPFIPLNDGRR